MKVSEVKVGQAGFAVALPNTDANALILNEKALQEYIAEHGDVEVVDINPEWTGRKTYDVPAFTKGREKACASKLAYCKQFGSN